jgi:hypothetical protein
MNSYYRVIVSTLFIMLALMVMTYGCGGGENSSQPNPTPDQPGSTPDADIPPQEEVNPSPLPPPYLDLPSVDPPPPPPLPSEDDTPSSGSGFNGTWTIYEERFMCNAGYANYKVTIEPASEINEATLTIGEQDMGCSIVEEQEMACSVVEDQLECTGVICLGGWAFYYDSYRLWRDEENNLIGEASCRGYRCNDTNISEEFCVIESNMTTVQPEFGSFIIENRSDSTISYVNVSPCKLDGYGSNILNSPIGPDHLTYFYDINPGCYNVLGCSDSESGNQSKCTGFKNQQLKVAETIELRVDN